MSKQRGGFTLVELLVVVAIIVVLLAILVPSMSRAIYLATVAKCAAQQKATALGVHSYGYDFKRYYPSRLLPAKKEEKTIGLPMLVGGNTPDGSFVPVDIRRQLNGYVQINKQLNDPFTGDINLEYQSPTGDTTIQCSYNLFFGWHYTDGTRGFRGMDKLGESWDFVYAGTKRSYGLLMGDLDLIWNYPANISASHPDVGGRPKLWLQTVENVFEITYGSKAIQSYWIQYTGGGVAQRGTLDLNNAYDDGSVHRLSNMAFDDDRYDYVPYFYDMQLWTGFRAYIPKR